MKSQNRVKFIIWGWISVFCLSSTCLSYAATKDSFYSYLYKYQFPNTATIDDALFNITEFKPAQYAYLFRNGPIKEDYKDNFKDLSHAISTELTANSEEYETSVPTINAEMEIAAVGNQVEIPQEIIQEVIEESAYSPKEQTIETPVFENISTPSISQSSALEVKKTIELSKVEMPPMPVGKVEEKAVSSQSSVKEASIQEVLQPEPKQPKVKKDNFLIGIGREESLSAQDLSIQKSLMYDLSEKPSGRVYAPGRVIVKFRSKGANALKTSAEVILNRRQKFKNYLDNKSDSLDHLTRRAKIRHAKRLFKSVKGDTLDEAQRNVEEMVNKNRRSKKFLAKAERNRKVVPVPDIANTYIISIPPEFDPEKVSAYFRQDPHVEFAEPDYLVKLNTADPSYSVLWGLHNTGQTILGQSGTADADIDAPEAWALNTGANIVVGVVDTGVDYTHPDLQNQIWVNPCEDLNSNGQVDISDFNGVDNACPGQSPNGYIDDIRGYDFTTCSDLGDTPGGPSPSNPYGFDCNGNVFNPDDPAADEPDEIADKSPDNDPMDGQDHGTHVSGTIAAIANNSVGIVGVAPSVKILPAKGLSDNRGYGWTSELAEGIEYAAQNGADVINNSWGSNSSAGFYVSQAIDLAYSLNVVIVFAAGNDNATVATGSPAGIIKTLGVAAIDNRNQKASFSNFGSLVDVSAPGVDIYSTLPGSTYSYFDGTSMAAPHVAGVAALILSYHASENFTNDQVQKIITQSADDIGLSLMGSGKVNAHEALTMTRVKPTINAGSDRTTTVGTLVQFNVTSTDPQSGINALTATLADTSALSTIGASFTNNGDNTGTFSWTPSGAYVGVDPSILFVATDTDGFQESALVQITVNPSLNCGDGTVDPGEECDDGDNVSGDGCSAACLTEVCGNNRTDFGEGCDDGNLVSGDGCTSACVDEFCGDGVDNDGSAEECDDGANVSGDGCSAACLTEVCGNNRTDFGEGCDDGNLVSGDGCTSACVDEFCGDGVDNDGSAEECDDGANVSGDGCSAACLTEVCGNNRTDFGEGCDDGNLSSGDGCTSACVDEFCGDGVDNDGSAEECDDGGAVSGDGCSNVCVIEFCGDGVVNNGSTEECDDGNNIDGDGCSATCIQTSVCGNLTCEESETCSNCWQDCGRCRGGSRPR